MKKTVNILLCFIFTLIGCTNTDEKTATEKPLKIFNWEEYIGSETIEKFIGETGIRVIEDHYEDEEEMFALVRSDLSAYDLVVASDDLVREMIEAKILSAIDKEKLANFKNLDDQFLNLTFDPGQTYSIPYLWGTTGIIINRKYIEENTDSWSVLFNRDHSGRIAMLNNPYEVLSAPLKIMGKSINSRETEVLEEAGFMLMEQKEYIAGYFDAVAIADKLVNEEIWAAQIYSGEGLAAMDENEYLDFIIPAEGAPIWLDTFVIPRDAENRDAAHEFLNFILDPEINASIASELWYATANREALKYMDHEVLESPAVFPDGPTLERCEYYQDIGEATRIVSKLWSELDTQGP